MKGSYVFPIWKGVNVNVKCPLVFIYEKTLIFVYGFCTLLNQIKGNILFLYEVMLLQKKDKGFDL